MVQLTEGALLSLLAVHSFTPSEKMIVQVISFQKKQFSNCDDHFWKVQLSDGIYASTYFCFGASVVDMIGESSMRPFTVIELQKWDRVVYTENGNDREFVSIQKCGIILRNAVQIGSPRQMPYIHSLAQTVR